MVRAQRRPPPETAGHLVRPRLLAALRARFDRRVVVVGAPAGYGKTTLLAQAIYENGLVSRGVDVWLACEPADAAANHLAFGLAEALGIAGPVPPDAERIAAAVWTRAPQHVALVLDDVHELGDGSPGSALLGEVLRRLPTNGHLVLAGREVPVAGLARLRAAGEVVTVAAEDLLFDAGDLRSFAALRQVDEASLAATGGWPALASLTVAAGAGGTEEYLWEEVLSRLGPSGRRALEVLSAADGGDDDLVSDVLAEPVDLAALLRAVPLVAPSADGWVRPHALWRPILAATSDPDERAALRRRAARALLARHDVARAVPLVLPGDDDEDWAVLADAIAEGCSLVHWVARADLLAGWHAALAERRRTEAEGLLLEATLSRLRQVVGEDVRPVLAKAQEQAAATGRTAAEVSALTHLGHLAWWQDDVALGARVVARTLALEAAGEPLAAGPAVVGRAMLAQVARDHDRMLAECERIPSEALDPDFRAVADWLRSRALINLGRAEEAIPFADRACRYPGLAFQAARMERLHARWHAGRLAEALELLAGIDPTAERLPRDRFLVGVNVASAEAFFGRPEKARRALAVARAATGAVEGRRPGLFLSGAEALTMLAEGDEAGAAALLRKLLDGSPIDASVIDVARGVVGVLYVVLAERRQELTAAALGPDQREAVAAAASLVAARQGQAAPNANRSDPHRTIAALGLALSVELAAAWGDEALVRLVMEYRPERIHELLGRAARSPWPPVAAGAKRMSRELPRPPRSRLYLRILGPTVLERGGVVVTDAEWRRERVRSLLAFLVRAGRATRSQVAAALWPDLPAEASQANLRVTLGYLHRVLEPDRPAGNATYVVATVGDVLVVACGVLTVDAVEFEALVDAAEADDRDGAPSVALAKYVQATALWQGDYLGDVYDEWANAERDRLLARFGRSCVRGSELAVAGGDVDTGLRLATRAIEADPWHEPAYRALMSAYLSRGDRSSARRALDRCHAALAELGVVPDEATAVLERRILQGT